MLFFLYTGIKKIQIILKPIRNLDNRNDLFCLIVGNFSNQFTTGSQDHLGR